MPPTRQALRPEVSDDKVTRLRNLAQLYTGQLPDDDAQNALVLLFDVGEILGLAPEKLERVFGPAVLTWVTGLVYGEGEAATVTG